MSARPVTHVVCFGNMYGGDDGVAIHAFQRLSARSWSSTVRFFDAGTRGLAALGLLDHCDRAILVDALETGSAPGTVRILAPDELGAGEACYSNHMTGVAELVRMLPLTFPAGGPEVIVVGVEIERLKVFSDRLSEPVAAAMENLLAAIERLLEVSAGAQGELMHHVDPT